MSDATEPEARYRAVLEEYLSTRSEQSLYKASLLTEEFIKDNLGPDDITLLHCESIQHLLDEENGKSNLDRLRGLGDAHQFLLELMIAYGVKYREYAERLINESLEQARAASDQRERAEILAMIAHEIATPLTAAHGGVSRAVRLLMSGDFEHLQPELSRARSALDRLRRLNEELREASLTEHGAEAPYPVLPHDLRQIIDLACNWGGVLAEEKGVTLTREHTGTPLNVQCNADGMQTVLTNVIANAIQYTPEGGKVEVRAYADEEGVVVEVCDSGIGMTPEVQARIFEKFYRGSEARGMSGQGLGLGMAISRQLMEAQHGSLQVAQSSPGKGTVMRLRLPAAQSEQPETNGSTS